MARDSLNASSVWFSSLICLSASSSDDGGLGESSREGRSNRAPSSVAVGFSSADIARGVSGLCAEDGPSCAAVIYDEERVIDPLASCGEVIWVRW